METILTHSPAEAAAFIRLGGIVAFPTETVYGLGADVFNAAAVEHIFKAKRRPADNPLIAHISDIRQVELLARDVPGAARKFMDSFFPGPLTLVVRKAPDVPSIATAGLDTIGIRMPRYEIASEFLKACDTPVVAPSANLSGRPSPTNWQAVYEDLNGRVDCILQGESTEIGLESTVVDCTGAVPLLLRPGSVSLAELQAVCPETQVSSVIVDGRPRSPGMLHRHYSPRARVMVVDPEDPVDTDNTAFIGLDAPQGQVRLARLCDSVDDYARTLFAFFRECDRKGIKTIYCERVSEAGVGAALMDRIVRAAENGPPLSELDRDDS